MATRKRTRTFRKVGAQLCRYSSNKGYYAVFDSHGKLIWKSLEVSDHERAGRKVGPTLEKHGRLDHLAQRLTLAGRLKLWEQKFAQFDRGWQANKRDSGYSILPAKCSVAE